MKILKGVCPNMSRILTTVCLIAILMMAVSARLAASAFTFSTGNPDGLIGALSRPAAPGLLETETADDFLLNQATIITQATFTGLLPAGLPLSSVTDIEIELYNIFPLDSTNPPDGRVPTRVNSPADNQFAAFNSAAGEITFSETLLNSNFSVLNTVKDGINPLPNQFTGGEGPASGQEVEFTVTFGSGFTLPAGHYFFRPEVGLTSGDFLWLSAPRPIVPPGTPFAGDLQAWTRNTDLDPDWLRIGTDITEQGPFNMTFTLAGDTVPEPGTVVILGLGTALIAAARSRSKRKNP